MADDICVAVDESILSKERQVSETEKAMEIFFLSVLSDTFIYTWFYRNGSCTIKEIKKGGVEKREKAYTNMAQNQQVNTKGENSHNEERKTNFIIDNDSLNAYRVSDF